MRGRKASGGIIPQMQRQRQSQSQKTLSKCAPGQRSLTWQLCHRRHHTWPAHCYLRLQSPQHHPPSAAAVTHLAAVSSTPPHMARTLLPPIAVPPASPALCGSGHSLGSCVIDATTHGPARCCLRLQSPQPLSPTHLLRQRTAAFTRPRFNGLHPPPDSAKATVSATEGAFEVCAGSFVGA